MSPAYPSVHLAPTSTHPIPNNTSVSVHSFTLSIIKTSNFSPFDYFHFWLPLDICESSFRLWCIERQISALWWSRTFFHERGYPGYSRPIRCQLVAGTYWLLFIWNIFTRAKNCQEFWWDVMKSFEHVLYWAFNRRWEPTNYRRLLLPKLPSTLTLNDVKSAHNGCPSMGHSCLLFMISSLRPILLKALL